MELKRIACPYCKSAFAIYNYEKKAVCPFCGKQVGVQGTYTPPAPQPKLNSLGLPASINTQKASHTMQASGLVSTCEWSATMALAIFLGMFGVHRIYTKHKIIALIQFCTLGGAGFWWAYDLVSLLSGKYTDAQGLPLKNPLGKTGKWPEFFVLLELTAIISIWIGMVVPATENWYFIPLSASVFSLMVVAIAKAVRNSRVTQQ